MSASDKRSYEFGPFRLDAAEYVLLRDGQVVPLTPKVFETLLVLVQNSGHIVDKNELYKQVWQDAFVEETNLTKNISILRKILSEGDGDRTFIETVPKRGYRFVVPVSESEPEFNGNRERAVTSVTAPVDVALLTANGKIKTSKYFFARVIGIAALVVAGVAFGLYRFAFPKRISIALAPTQMSRLTSSGTVVLCAISSDGKWLTYVENDGDRESLWLKQVAVPSSKTQLIGPAAGRYTGVIFSPDGNYVYYTLEEAAGAHGTLYQVPVLGGAARKLITGIIGPVTFSPDGKRIAYFYWINDEDRLMVANADGSEKRQLVTRSGNEYFVHATNGPSWSPDGKTLLTSVGTFTPQMTMTVAAVSPESGAVTLFSQQRFRQIWDLTWMSDGQGILVSAAEHFGVTGTSKIWHITYPSGAARRITNDLNSYRRISLTQDSNALAAVQTEAFGNLWTASANNLDRGTQITTGRNLTNSPSWTRDGKVIYASNSGGNFDLYLLELGGGNPRQLTANSGNNTSPVVSPDGRHVVFVSDRSGSVSLWRIGIDGSNPKQLTTHTSMSPNFAPDGRTVVYTSLVNKFTIGAINIDGDEARQLTSKPSLYPVFSPDGTQIACVYSPEENTEYRISIMPAAGGAPAKTFPLPSGFSAPFRWTADGKALIYAVSQRGVTNLWVQPIEGGEPKQLTNFTSDLIHWFDISRDGKQFVLSRGTSSSDVVLFSGIAH